MNVSIQESVLATFDITVSAVVAWIAAGWFQLIGNKGIREKSKSVARLTPVSPLLFQVGMEGALRENSRELHLSIKTRLVH